MADTKINIENTVGIGKDSGDSKLYDYITKQEIPNKPENREAKVVFEERLHKEYLYDLKQMQPEFEVRKGSV